MCQPSCVVCAAGTYAGVGATECTACAGGTYDHDAETHSDNLPASTACVVCGAGNTATATTCVPCAAGTADLNGISSDACDACVAETSFTDAAGQQTCTACEQCVAADGKFTTAPCTVTSQQGCTQ